jgi:hypothetical protein
MSANDDNDINDDTEITDEYKKILKDLVKILKDEFKEIKKGTKFIQQDNSWREKSHKYKLEELQLHDDNVAAHIKLRASLKGAQTQMQMFTGLMRNGVTVGTVFGTLVNKGKGLADSYSDAASAVTKLEEKISNLTELIEKTKDAGEKEEFGKQKEAAESDLSDAKAAFGEQGKLGQGLSAMGEFAKKHAAGILIGAGAAGTLLKVLKMAFDASPMFQQMRKLLAFGVNMILRPIGDFFGFLMRPVLIMLMRKLILPWYQRMMPTMIKMGDDIGKILALIPNWAIENLFSNMTFTPRDDDPLFGKQGAISKWAKELEDFDWGTTLTSNILGVTAFWSSIETFFKNVAGAINEKLYGYWNKYKSFIQDLGHIQNWIGWAWDKFVNFFRDTLGGIWDAIGGAWHKFVSFFQSIGGFASFAGITAANGYDGVVTRPTMMMVGERGAERVSVTPSGQTGGGGVTINIQNMVGSSGDIERLRSMILDVLQSSSSNRVRV